MNKRGMTLLELMIVLILLAAIASISYPNISKMARRSEVLNHEQHRYEIMKDVEYRSALKGEIYVVMDDGIEIDVMSVEDYMDVKSDFEGEITWVLPSSYED